MTERRSATILAADVAGYTAMMQSDEERAFERVSALIEQVSRVIAEEDGRVVSIAGDGLIACFDSAPRALRASRQFQDALADAASAEPEDQQVLCRVGINSGEVVMRGRRSSAAS